MICAGIDGGSRAIKVVLLDAGTQEVLAAGVRDQGINHGALAAGLFDELLAGRGLQRASVARIIATGYTRNLIRMADTTITEITCHAYGVRRLVPQARTIIEVGGQDSKLLRLDDAGRVRDFAMNDRCAAGTGRFLEVIAARLASPVEALGELARGSCCPAAISSTCVVFAESEVIGLLASGASPPDIVAGVQAAIAARIAGLAGGSLEPPVVLTGGVALIPGMADALARALGQPISVAPRPQMTGALGAAILACNGTFEHPMS